MEHSASSRPDKQHAQHTQTMVRTGHARTRQRRRADEATRRRIPLLGCRPLVRSRPGQGGRETTQGHEREREGRLDTRVSSVPSGELSTCWCLGAVGRRSGQSSPSSSLSTRVAQVRTSTTSAEASDTHTRETGAPGKSPLSRCRSIGVAKQWERHSLSIRLAPDFTLAHRRKHE